MSSRARRSMIMILAISIVMSVAVALTSGARAAEPSAVARTTKPAAISWLPCGDILCGTLAVPLDYDRPRGPQIALALAKVPATDPGRRIGSILINPGGPGGSGVDFARANGRLLFIPEVRARFDIVGFDPRGIARSTPLRCYATQEAAAAISPFAYPNSRSRERAWIARERGINEACARRAGPIIDHMSTANVARDMDRIRQAVGDRKLTYYGISYGSFLGTVYANLFPDRFRALVIDGVLDPVAWTTGRRGQGRDVPFSTRLRSAVGAQDTLEEFFRLCDAHPSTCALAPRSSQRYAKLYRDLRRDPIETPLPDGSTQTYDETSLVGATLPALYRSRGWPALASALSELIASKSTADRAAAVQGLRRLEITEDYVNAVEGFPGVGCSDSVNPRSYGTWRRAADSATREEGYFGRIWTWATSICAEWRGSDRDRYLGPFDRKTDQTVLVVGNLFDPATRYQGAVIADRLLPNSRLLTLRGWGHTSLFQSACVDSAIGRYLISGVPPTRGTVCDPDVIPFEGPPAPQARRSAQAESVSPRW